MILIQDVHWLGNHLFSMWGNSSVTDKYFAVSFQKLYTLALMNPKWNKVNYLREPLFCEPKFPNHESLTPIPLCSSFRWWKYKSIFHEWVIHTKLDRTLVYSHLANIASWCILCLCMEEKKILFISSSSKCIKFILDSSDK